MAVTGKRIVVFAAAFIVLAAGIIPSLAAGEPVLKKNAQSSLFVGQPDFIGLSGTFDLGRGREVTLQCRRLHVEYEEIAPGVKVSASWFLVVVKPEMKVYNDNVRVFTASADEARITHSKKSIEFLSNARLSHVKGLEVTADSFSWDWTRGTLVLKGPYEYVYDGSAEMARAGRHLINLKEIESK